MLQVFTPLEDVLKILDMLPARLDRACRSQKKMSFFRFSEQQYALGRAEILRLQAQCAETGKGNPRVLIWLGMQHCGQSMRSAQIYKPKGPTQGTAPTAPKPHAFVTGEGTNAVVPITEPVPADVAHKAKEAIDIEAILMEEELELTKDPGRASSKPTQSISAHTGKVIDG